MPILLWQLTPGEVFRPIDAPTGTTHWMLTGTEDEAAMVAVCDTNIPSFLLNTPLQDYRAQHLGGGVWVIEVHYGLVPPLAIGSTVWDIDAVGGREKIYHSLKTVFSQSATSLLNTPIPDTKGGINETTESVEGVEVYVPAMKMTGKRRYKTSSFTSNYIQDLEQKLTASINQAPWSFIATGLTYNFEKFEVLFIGAKVTVVDIYRVEIDHEFIVSRNRLITSSPPNGLVLQGFDAPVQKYGHDYGWIKYGNNFSNGNKTKYPIAFYSEKVYKDGDFTILQL